MQYAAQNRGRMSDDELQQQGPRARRAVRRAAWPPTASRSRRDGTHTIVDASYVQPIDLAARVHAIPWPFSMHVDVDRRQLEQLAPPQVARRRRPPARAAASASRAVSAATAPAYAASVTLPTLISTFSRAPRAPGAEQRDGDADVARRGPVAVRGDRDRLVERRRRQAHHAERHVGRRAQRLLDGGLARGLLVGGSPSAACTPRRPDRRRRCRRRSRRSARSRRPASAAAAAASAARSSSEPVARLRQPRHHHQQRRADRADASAAADPPPGRRSRRS